MKKYWTLIMTGAFFLVACSASSPSVSADKYKGPPNGAFEGISFFPEGKWLSEDPYLLLDIQWVSTSNRPFDAKGVYVKDGESIEVCCEFPTNDNTMQIYPIRYATGDEILMAGEYEMDGEKLVYTLTPYDAEQLGYDKIVFTRVESE